MARAARRQNRPMHIRDWPPSERPREKLLALGSGALSEAELLAIWLRHGSSGMNALDLARSLLGRFGSLRALLSAGRNDLCDRPGIGPARWAELQAALELVRRHHLERLQAGPVLASPRAARDYLISRLRDLEHEVFCCLFLDSRHRLTSCEELFRGTVDGASVAIRRNTEELDMYRILAAFLGFFTIAAGVLAAFALFEAEWESLGWYALAALVLGALYAIYSAIAKQQTRR